MSVSTPLPPAPPRKKSGWGCLGCGCGVLLLLAVAGIGLLIVACVATYHKVESLTSSTQSDIPTFTGDPAVLSGAQKKISAFQREAQAHRPATLHLSSDEINALVASSPDISSSGVRAYITLTDDQARVQASTPTDKIVKGVFPGRYLNFDGMFSLTFDSAAKSVQLTPHALQIGPMPLIGPDTEKSTAASISNGFAPINQSLNQQLRKNGAAEVLDHARTITIKNSELVIETE